MPTVQPPVVWHVWQMWLLCGDAGCYEGKTLPGCSGQVVKGLVFGLVGCVLRLAWFVLVVCLGAFVWVGGWLWWCGKTGFGRGGEVEHGGFSTPDEVDICSSAHVGSVTRFGDGPVYQCLQFVSVGLLLVGGVVGHTGLFHSARWAGRLWCVVAYRIVVIVVPALAWVIWQAAGAGGCGSLVWSLVWPVVGGAWFCGSVG